MHLYVKVKYIIEIVEIINNEIIQRPTAFYKLKMHSANNSFSILD